MDQKIAGIGIGAGAIGAMLVISLVAIMGSAYAQDTETAPATGFTDVDNDGVCDNFVDADGVCDHKYQREGFIDADNDGVCDNAANCQKHQNREGCHGSEGCSKMKEGFRRGCHRAATE